MFKKILPILAIFSLTLTGCSSLTNQESISKEEIDSKYNIFEHIYQCNHVFVSDDDGKTIKDRINSCLIVSEENQKEPNKDMFFSDLTLSQYYFSSKEYQKAIDSFDRYMKSKEKLKINPKEDSIEYAFEKTVKGVMHYAYFLSLVNVQGQESNAVKQIALSCYHGYQKACDAINKAKEKATSKEE